VLRRLFTFDEEVFLLLVQMGGKNRSAFLSRLILAEAFDRGLVGMEQKRSGRHPKAYIPRKAGALPLKILEVCKEGA